MTSYHQGGKMRSFENLATKSVAILRKTCRSFRREINRQEEQSHYKRYNKSIDDPIPEPPSQLPTGLKRSNGSLERESNHKVEINPCHEDSSFSDTQNLSNSLITSVVIHETAIVHQDACLDRNIGLFKAKYVDGPTPQKVQIVNTLAVPESSSQDESHSPSYINPRDLVFPSVSHTLPSGSAPPKPPRKNLKKLHKKESTIPSDAKKLKRRCIIYSSVIDLSGSNMSKETVTKYDNNENKKDLKCIENGCSHIYWGSWLNADEYQELPSSLKRKTFPSQEPGPVYAQVTPRSSRNLGSNKPSSTCFNENNIFPNPSHSEDFLPAATSSLEMLDKETKEALDLIHHTQWSLNNQALMQNHECNKEKMSPESMRIEKKFVVNTFESRPSKRWERHFKNGAIRASENEINEYISIDENIQKLEEEFQGLNMDNIDLVNSNKHLSIQLKLNISMPRNNEVRNEEIEPEYYTEVDQGIEDDERNREECRRYRALRKARDVQCIKMVQASNALEEIKSKRYNKGWLEVLVAEKILLETHERMNLITQQITDSIYTFIPEPPLCKGTLQLSGIRVPFLQDKLKYQKHFTDFFLMTISHGIHMYISEFLTGEESSLVFKRSYTFRDVAPDFEIKIKLFRLKLRTSNEYFWEKFSCSGCCKKSTIIYEDHLIREYQQKSVFKTSFKLCAEASLTKSHINQGSTNLVVHSDVVEYLDEEMDFNFKCEDIDMAISLAGFLDVGTLLGETYFWEKKWCALRGPNLLIYNYPQDEYFGKPVEQINLEYCFGPIETKVENCSRQRCFQLKTGIPNDATKFPNMRVATLRTKPNFALRKFYFASRDKDNYLKWMEEVKKLLDSLKYFKKLVFEEEYYECVPT